MGIEKKLPIGKIDKNDLHEIVGKALNCKYRGDKYFRGVNEERIKNGDIYSICHYRGNCALKAHCNDGVSVCLVKENGKLPKNHY